VARRSATALLHQHFDETKVIGVIYDLCAELKKEQLDDENKKEYYDVQFDLADDKKKTLEKTAADLEIAIAESKENILTSKEHIDALERGVRALDKSVAEATEGHAATRPLNQGRSS